jgi:putative ABC transport system permease protein
MNAFLKDLRYSVRSLLLRPGFTAVALIALGLAIGAGTAMFSVVNAVILKPLNFDGSENVVIIWESAPKLHFDIFTASPANFADWRTQAKSFEFMAAYSRSQFTLTGFESAERVPGAQVSADYFKLVRTPPMIGRTFFPEETMPGKDKVAVVSYGFWNRRLGADPGAVGKTLTLNGEQYNIVGVMPERFMYPSNSEIWTPMDVNASQGRGGHFLVALGRPRGGVSIDTAGAEMKMIAVDLEKAYPATNEGWTTKVVNLHDDIIKDIRQSLLILFGAVAFVLLIACANVANLLLARGSDRAKEIAVRTAMGASRSRIVRQLLTESVILSVAGGLLGVGIAFLALRSLVAVAPPNLPRIQETTIDRTVLAFTVGISIATGLGFGMFPAFQMSRTNLHDALKESVRGSSAGAERHRMRNLLVIAEIALSIVVLTGAGLMLQSLRKLVGVDPGFNPRNVLTAQFNLPAVRYPNDDAKNAFLNRLVEHLSAMPGVTNVATVNSLPLSGSTFIISYSIAGRPPILPQNEPSALMRFTTSDYFKTLQVPIVKGRAFTAEDRITAPPVIIINEAFVRREFPNEDPIGKQMLIGYSNNPGPRVPRTIVGVVRDMRITSLSDEAEPQYYVPYSQLPFSGVSLALRTAGDPAQLASPLRNEMKNLDSSIALFNLRPFEDVLSTSIAQARFNGTLLAVFSGVALLLASVGVYGVMAYSVNQRTHEIGIRLALGQRRASILTMVLYQAIALAGIGALLGVTGAAGLTRFMTTMLFHVNASDPITYIVVVSVLMAVALSASYLPARRATRVDPMTALREE